MALKPFRPLTPSQRFTSLNKPEGLSKKRPEAKLTESKPKTGGRNVYGRITSRRRGGGHKQLYRIIDFKRDILDMPAKVQAIEYDPNRTAHIALLAYTSGEITLEAASGGTFTVTDLSGEGVFSFQPLINQRQSAILGVGAEFLAPGGSEGFYQLILTFDHRLTEGRAAAQFLKVDYKWDMDLDPVRATLETNEGSAF